MYLKKTRSWGAYAIYQSMTSSTFSWVNKFYIIKINSANIKQCFEKRVLILGMWKRSILVPLPLPCCSTNTCSYPIFQNGSGQSTSLAYTITNKIRFLPGIPCRPGRPSNPVFPTRPLAPSSPIRPGGPGIPGIPRYPWSPTFPFSPFGGDGQNPQSSPLGPNKLRLNGSQ